MLLGETLLLIGMSPVLIFFESFATSTPLSCSTLDDNQRDGTYDPRPQRSVRKTRPETFRKLDPEIGSRVFVSGLPKDITNQDLEVRHKLSLT